MSESLTVVKKQNAARLDDGTPDPSDWEAGCVKSIRAMGKLPASKSCARWGSCLGLILTTEADAA